MHDEKQARETQQRMAPWNHGAASVLLRANYVTWRSNSKHRLSTFWGLLSSQTLPTETEGLGKWGSWAFSSLREVSFSSGICAITPRHLIVMRNSRQREDVDLINFRTHEDFFQCSWLHEREIIFISIIKFKQTVIAGGISSMYLNLRHEVIRPLPGYLVEALRHSLQGWTVLPMYLSCQMIGSLPKRCRHTHTRLKHWECSLNTSNLLTITVVQCTQKFHLHMILFYSEQNLFFQSDKRHPINAVTR